MARGTTPTLTRQDWRDVEPVLTKALQLPESEREALVDSAELKDVLRREIVELLRSGTARSSPPPTASVVTLTSGETLDNGRFVVVRQIGRGGMGAVYLAQDTVLATLVALKLVPPDERFIREAQRAAVCSGHEHVSVMHNVLRTEHRGEPVGVLVMEHVEGRPASRILEDGPVEIDRALRWTQQVASAVAHAHDCEVLHCDLKPANFIVTPDDRVKVLDFGIARASFDANTLNEPAYGTLPYMAPEQLSSGEFSRASDVYSLGVTLFELVTGRRPFEGDEPMLRMKILAAPPPKVSEIVPEASPALDALVERALAKNPEDRFRSARAFAHAVEQLLPHKSTGTYPVVPAPPPPRPDLRPLWAFAAAIAGLVAMSWTFGLVACRSFEVFLRVDSEFAASPGDYFKVGREALLPFAPLWTIAAAAAATCAGLLLLVRWSTPRRWQTWRSWWKRLDPNALAVTALLAGVAAWLTLTWNYRDLFVALFELQQNPTAASVEPVSFSSRPDHLNYASASALLSFFLVLVGAIWFPHLKKRCSDPTTIRGLTWATLALAIIVMLGPTVPRRFLFERFRVVEYQGEGLLAIGSSGDNLLLYDSRRRVSLKVRGDAQSLRTTEKTRLIFEDE